MHRAREGTHTRESWLQKDVREHATTDFAYHSSIVVQNIEETCPTSVMLVVWPNSSSHLPMRPTYPEMTNGPGVNFSSGVKSRKEMVIA